MGLLHSLTGVATMGPRGAMVPSLLSYFSIVSMSWFTFAIVSIFIIMLWPPHLFSARNAPAFTHVCVDSSQTVLEHVPSQLVHIHEYSVSSNPMGHNHVYSPGSIHYSLELYQ